MIMKLRALSIIVVSAAVVAMAQDGVKLRRTFSSNTEDLYVCEYSGNNSVEAPTGQMDFKIKGSNNLVIKYKDVKDAAVNIDMVTKDMKFEMEGMPDGMGGAPGADQMPKEITVSGTLDERNRVKFGKSNAPMDPMTQSMLSSLSSTNTGFFVEFPEGPVKVGESWEIKMPKTSEKSPDTTLKATLTADKGSQWEVTVAGKFPMKVDSAEAAKGNQNAGGMQMEFIMNMTMDTTYTIMVDKASGKTQSVTGKIGTKMSMELPSFGMTIPGSGNMTFTAKLKQ